MQSAGRRREGRLRLDIDALLIDVQRTQRVRLLDISARGTKLQTEIPPRIGSGAFVRWQGQEVFGTVAWTRGGFCGIAFDRPLSLELLVQLRDDTSLSTRQVSTAQTRQAAQTWAQGWGGTKPAGPAGGPGRRNC